MLLPSGQTPDNSTTPRTEAYFAAQSGNDLYALFATGITTPGTCGGNAPAVGSPASATTSASAALASLESFLSLSPAGTSIPMVIPGPAPVQNNAIVAPAPVSPLATQVAGTLAHVRQGLVSTGTSPALQIAAESQGQEGAVSSGDYSDAAEVIPLGFTQNQHLEQQLKRTGSRQRKPGNSRRSYDLPPSATNPNFPGTPWGGVAARQTCPPSTGGLTIGQILFLLAGGLVIAVAVGQGSR